MTTNQQPATSNNQLITNDEIDLIELIKLLWSKKLTIIGVTTLTTAVAVAVAFNMTKVYKAELVITPPDFASKIYLKSALREVGTAGFNNHTETIDFVNSFETKHSFYNLNDDVKTLYPTFKNFNTALKFVLPKKRKETSPIEVSFSAPSYEQADTILNKYLTFAKSKHFAELKERVEILLKYKDESKQYSIENYNKVVKVAKAFESGSANKEVILAKGSQQFLYGSKVLEEQLKQLEEEVVEVEFESDKYSSFELHKNEEDSMTPIKPNKKLITIAGFILGLMLAVFGISTKQIFIAKQ